MGSTAGSRAADDCIVEVDEERAHTLGLIDRRVTSECDRRVLEAGARRVARGRRGEPVVHRGAHDELRDLDPDVIGLLAGARKVELLLRVVGGMQRELDEHLERREVGRRCEPARRVRDREADIDLRGGREHGQRTAEVRPRGPQSAIDLAHRAAEDAVDVIEAFRRFRASHGPMLARPMLCWRSEATVLKEFRDFIIKGNAFQLAIGVILAVAFGALVVAFTEGVLMAIIAAIVGKPDFNALAFDLNGTPIQYGRVLTATVNLVLVGFVLFLVVKAVNRVVPPPKAAETDHELLAQIRDELRSRPARVDVTVPAPAR